MSPCPYPQYQEMLDGKCVGRGCPATEDCPGDLNGQTTTLRPELIGVTIALAPPDACADCRLAKAVAAFLRELHGGDPHD